MPTSEPPAAARKRCFVISRIGGDGSEERRHADRVLKHIIKKALVEKDFLVERADDGTDPGSITPRIVADILRADLVVADLTGFNANVFYELAIAHGYGKPTVQLLEKGEKPPFDLKDINTIAYDIADPDDIEATQKRLASFVKTALNSPKAIVTPLSGAGGFVAVESSIDPVAESNFKVMEALQELRGEVQRLRPVTARRSPSMVNTSQYKADRLGMKTIIDAIAADGRLEAEDLQSVINQDTSQNYDDWIVSLITAMGKSEKAAERWGYHESIQVGDDDD